MRKLIILLSLALLAGCSSLSVVNGLTPSTGYNLAINLPFDPATGLTADVYTPDGARNAPVVVFFYGGRWSEGDKQEYKLVGQALASRGIVAVIPNYRKYPQVRFPAFVEDGAKAVKWARNNAAAYGGNPEQLFVMGHSAGAHIAAMLALNEAYLKKVGGSRTWLRGMIGLAGPYNFLPITAPDLRDMFGPPEQFEQSQPVFFADGRNPPLLLLHGENDEVVAAANSRSLAKAVAAQGGSVETIFYPKLSHANILGAVSTVVNRVVSSDVLEHISNFVQEKRNFQLPSIQTPSDIQAVPLEIEMVPMSSP
ncbi:alpha/beta hydrolase [Solimonas sp. K1W22B-7]|uniref:alpha/beta hydrolase n=1 Tax=Solimonas sp. K1W22B-7 TaxID=2303331 RepID=UPI001F08C74D|nr:alpha/beta hydrolase [Solimonas sp. K1W22B-7]